MDCNLPGSSIHGIFQALILECGAISFSILPKSKHLLIYWLQLHSAVILEPKRRKSVTVSSVQSHHFMAIRWENNGYRFIIYGLIVLSYVPSMPTFGEGNGIPLQYSCLENPMDGGAW